MKPNLCSFRMARRAAIRSRLPRVATCLLITIAVIIVVAVLVHIVIIII